jgi:hypothetical protein
MPFALEELIVMADPFPLLTEMAELFMEVPATQSPELGL